MRAPERYGRFVSVEIAMDVFSFDTLRYVINAGPECFGPEGFDPADFGPDGIGPECFDPAGGRLWPRRLWHGKHSPGHPSFYHRGPVCITPEGSLLGRKKFKAFH